MKKHKLGNMTKGWFVGDFAPVAVHSREAEVAVKHYQKGDHEELHVHKIATEITLIAAGSARMGDEILEAGDILTIEPGESTDFECLADGTMTVVVKLPSVAGDKYVCGE